MIHVVRIFLAFGTGWFAGNVLQGRDRPYWFRSLPTLVLFASLAIMNEVWIRFWKSESEEYSYRDWDRWNDDE